MKYFSLSSLLATTVFVFGMYLSACMPRTIKSPQNSNDPQPEGFALYFYQTRFAKFPDSANFSYSNAKFTETEEIRLFYRRRLFKPAWTRDLMPTKSADSLIDIIDNSLIYGLSPGFYNSKLIHSLRAKFSDTLDLYHELENMSNFELLMSNAAFKLSKHLHRGFIVVDTVPYKKKEAMSKIDLTSIVNNGIKKGNVVTSILKLQPTTKRYTNLLKSYQWFIEHSDMDTISIKIPDPKKDSVLAYQLANNVLVKNGFLFESKNSMVSKHGFSSEGFSKNPNHSVNNSWQLNDSIFINALKIFQRFNGLNQDGKIGKYTIQALERTNNHKFWQILLALNKLKWEAELPKTYIYVNIPSYLLRYIRNDSVLDIHRVVVGKSHKQTPLFTDTMEYFITYPEWNVPISISYHEILPKLRSDTTYTERNNYIVYDKDLNAVNVRDVDWSQVDRSNFKYSIKQSGGNSNALGTIKFIFPNEHYVYIHDTPSKQYFSKDVRAFSHGCVRLDKPWEFAEFIVNNDQRSSFIDTLRIFRKNKLQRYVMLNEPIPVLIRYITVEADNKNNLFFYTDVYDRDDPMIKEMKRIFKQSEASISE